jgi:hypothetical protein
MFDHGAVAPAEEVAHDAGSGRRTDERSGAPGPPGTTPATTPGGVADLAGRVRPTDLARDRRLPVLPALDGVLPASGLRRGTTAAVVAAPGVTGATSLALALASGASQAGSWVAAVGLGSLGLVAAAEMGVAFQRLVLVADPGRDRDGWASVIAALVDGFDVVLVAARPLRPADARRLVARVRERGAVLVAVGGGLPGGGGARRRGVGGGGWVAGGGPGPALCRPGLRGGRGSRGGGRGVGWAHLRGRRVMVEAGGRGEAARGRRAELWLPDPDGAVTVVESVAEPIPLRSRSRRRERSSTARA